MICLNADLDSMKQSAILDALPGLDNSIISVHLRTSVDRDFLYIARHPLWQDDLLYPSRTL